VVVKSATKKKLIDIGVNEWDAHQLADGRKWDSVGDLTAEEIWNILLRGSGLYVHLEDHPDKRPDPQDRATRIHHLIMLSRLLHPHNWTMLNKWIRENLNPTYRFLINSWQFPITTIDPTDYVNDDLIEGLLPGDTERIVSRWREWSSRPDDWKLL